MPRTSASKLPSSVVRHHQKEKMEKIHPVRQTPAPAPAQAVQLAKQSAAQLAQVESTAHFRKPRLALDLE